MSGTDPEKTWQHSVNRLVGAVWSYDVEVYKVVIDMKNALTSFALNPWELLGTSDGDTYGMDGVDRWATWTSSVVKDGTWAVLRQPGTDAELLIAIPSTSSSKEYTVRAYMSPAAGFTGGDDVNRPTATDEIRFLYLPTEGSGTPFIETGMANEQVRLHAFHTTDGTFTHVVATRAARAVMHFMFGRPLAVGAFWSNPLIARWQPNANAYELLTDEDIVGNRIASGRKLVAVTESMIASGGSFADWVANYPNDLTGERPLAQVALHDEETGAIGEVGRIPDLWLSPGDDPAGTTYAGGTWAAFGRYNTSYGNFALPWNGSAVQMGA